MMKYRTDLALEMMEMAVSKADDSGENAGENAKEALQDVNRRDIGGKEDRGNGVKVTRIEITNGRAPGGWRNPLEIISPSKLKA